VSDRKREETTRLRNGASLRCTRTKSGRIFRAIESSAPHASQEGERQRGELMRGQDTGGREHVVGEPTEAPDAGAAWERSRLRCFTGRGRLISVERTSGEWRGEKLSWPSKSTVGKDQTTQKLVRFRIRMRERVRMRFWERGVGGI